MTAYMSAQFPPSFIHQAQAPTQGLGTEDGRATISVLEFVLEDNSAEHFPVQRKHAPEAPADTSASVWTEFGGFHSLLIRNIPRDFPEMLLRHHLSFYGDIYALELRWLRDYGSVLVTFYDLRQCERARRELTQDTTLGAHLVVLPFPFIEIEGSDGCNGVVEVWGLNGVADVGFFAQYGDVRKLTRNAKSMVIEYYDIRDARRARERLSQRSIGEDFGPIGCSFVSGTRSWEKALHKRFIPTVPQPSMGPAVAAASYSHVYGMNAANATSTSTSASGNAPPALHGISIVKQNGIATAAAVSAYAGAMENIAPSSWQPQSQQAPPPQLMVVSTSSSSSQSQSQPPPPPQPQPPSSQQSLVTRSMTSPSKGASSAAGGRPGRSPSASSMANEVQLIDVDRIRMGRDTRTTVMIRHIPNKYTQDMLLEALNKTHSRKYDFVYLPIDFGNHCNVGYAFVNFMNPIDIISFVEQFAGKKWERFNSDKICSLNYARIQGKENLIRHFKHSGVMNEQKKYRPKLFYSDGERAGFEEPWPETDEEYQQPQADTSGDKLSRIIASSKRPPQPPPNYYY